MAKQSGNLNVIIDPELMQKVKMHAAACGAPMSEWVQNALHFAVRHSEFNSETAEMLKRNGNDAVDQCKRSTTSA